MILRILCVCLLQHLCKLYLICTLGWQLDFNLHSDTDSVCLYSDGGGGGKGLGGMCLISSQFSSSISSRCRYVFVIVSYLIGVFIFATIVGECPAALKLKYRQKTENGFTSQCLNSIIRGTENLIMQSWFHTCKWFQANQTRQMNFKKFRNRIPAS